MKNKDVKQELRVLAEEKYRQFSMRLLPGVNNILGVRLPALRKISKKIIKTNWRGFIRDNDNQYFEQTMLEGMVIAGADCDFSEKLELIEKFIPKINNWSVCDSFCSSLKILEVDRSEFWEFLQSYFASEDEFESRFAVVSVIGNFIEKDYLEQIFEKINNMKSGGYYSEMGVAWAISAIYVKFPDETLSFLRRNNLKSRTFQKACQKIIESLRVSDSDKNIIRELKKGFDDSRN